MTKGDSITMQVTKVLQHCTLCPCGDDNIKQNNGHKINTVKLVNDIHLCILQIQIKARSLLWEPKKIHLH